MPQAQIVSIDKLRADAVRVTRGLFTLWFFPGFYLLLRSDIPASTTRAR